DGCYFCYVKENINLKKLNDWQIYLNLSSSIYPKIKLSTADTNTLTSGIDTTNSMDLTKDSSFCEEKKTRYE
ncbi:hypothetical protein A3Q56_08797, partial [Intoshia linei]